MVMEIGSGFEWLFLDSIAVLAALAPSARPVDAVRLLGAEAAIADRTGLNVRAEPVVADAKVALRELLGETDYQAAFQAGRQLSQQDTLVLMRELLGEFETSL
jgi:hypothetical protein